MASATPSSRLLAVLDLDIRRQRRVQSPTMAARATWKGFLKISLVNIPIKVFPATESSGTISFQRMLSRRRSDHAHRQLGI